MESFEEIKGFWAESRRRETVANSMSKESVEKVIKSRVRREKNIIMEYFWASFVYQMFIYGFASHLIIKFWGDSQIMLWSLSGAILYIPFTVIMMRKFKAMCIPTINRINSSGQPIQASVMSQYTLLSEFFRFKKGFDWVGIPFSSFILVTILFKLYVQGGVEEHLTASIISYVAVLIAFVAATYFENRKRFISPLRQLELALEDLNASR